LSSCESATCRLTQSCQPATGIIVIDIHALLDYADTINNLPGLIKFKRYLGQAVEIAVWIGAHHEHNLWFGEPYFFSSEMLTCIIPQYFADPMVSRFLCRFALPAGLVHVRQAFVRRCQSLWWHGQSSRDERDRLSFSRVGNHLKSASDAR